MYLLQLWKGLLNLTELKNLIKRSIEIFKIKRIRKYGLEYTITEFLILLCHRKNTRFEHKVTYHRDVIIDKYLKMNYNEVLKKYYF